MALTAPCSVYLGPARLISLQISQAEHEYNHEYLPPLSNEAAVQITF